MKVALACLLVEAAVLWPAMPNAEEKRFGYWTVGVITGEQGVYAATINDSGGLLGQYCLKEDLNCLWILANDIGCEPGNRYPVLVNADTGAASTYIACLNVGGKTRYVFADFELIDRTIRTAEWFGVAFPLKSGQFQVSRFSMEGAAKALAILHKAMDAVIENAARSTTKDQSF